MARFAVLALALLLAGIAVAVFALRTGPSAPRAAKQPLLSAVTRRGGRVPPPPATDVLDTTSPAPKLPPRGRPVLLQLSQAFFPPAEFEVTNQWHGPVGGRWYDVFAGGVPDLDGRVRRGGLRIYAEQLDPNGAPPPQLVGEFDSTEKTRLTIRAFHGLELTVAGARGRTLRFNLRTLKYG